jgi:hypothetical protein
MLTAVRSRNSIRRRVLSLCVLLLITAWGLSISGCSGFVTANNSKPQTPQSLTITNVQSSAKTTSGFQVQWSTNLAANSSVEYGTSVSYGSTTPVDSSMVTSHQLALTNLKSATMYHYRVKSTDASNTSAMSGDFTTATTGDTTPPTVSITAPAANATLSGTVNVTASATDNVGIASVQFKVDNANTGAAITAAPYTYSLNTVALSNANHIISAVATDLAGNTATSAGVTVKVSNGTPDTTPPTVSISSPAGGATVSGTISVTANASDNVGVASVQFQLDGANLGSLDTASPYSVSWTTTATANGSHTLKAVAKDAAGNSTTSAGVSVTVNNTAAPAPTISAVAAAQVQSNTATITWTTNVAADSQVDYGTTASYGLSSPLDASLVTSHSEPLSGLTASTTYHFRVKSKNSSGSLATSADFTFTTAATPPIQTGTSLSSLAASMKPGSWAQLTGTVGFNSGNILRPPSGGSVLEYMDRGSWNPINKTAMILGAAHSSNPGAANAFAKFTDSTNTWSLLTDPSPTFDNAFGDAIGHGYNHNTVDTSTGDFYHRQYYSGKVMKFSQSSQTWSQCSVYNTGGGVYQVAGALEYFPDRHSLVMLDGDWGVWELSITGGNCTGGWVERASTIGGGMSPQLTGMSSYHNVSHYSALCQCIIMGGDGTTLYKYDKNGNFTVIATSPAEIGIPQQGSGSIFTVDPVGGGYLAWVGTGTAYQYDPQANTWSTTGISSPILPGPEGRVTETVAIPISDYGVVMFVQVSSSAGGPASVWLYKHTDGAPAQGGGGPGATTITSVSTTGITTTSAVISWTTSAAADSQVAYGTTTSYGQTTALNSTMVTSHSVTLSGLAAGTLYHFQVKSRDGSGTLVSSGDFSFVTSDGTSNTPPTVSMVSPANGSTATGSVTLSASASSSAGIANVQFLLDSASLGSPVTASPYSMSWDTTTASNGTHVLAAVATDKVANTATSVAVTVTVSNNSTPTGSADFQTRCTAPGVLRCVGFDQASDIQGTWGDNVGILTGDSTPVLDSTVKSSGNSSLKFTIPSLSSANSSGSYFANFSTDLSQQFGENSDFYIQWRQRFSPEFLTSAYSGGEGWKQSIMGTGDVPGCTSGMTSAACSTSCTDLELVTLNDFQRGFAQMYDSCTGSTSHGPYSPLEESFGSFDFKLQNAMPAPFCLYSQKSTSYLPPVGNCFGYFPNEWMTFQVHVHTGPRVNDEFTNSRIQLWIAREGQPSQLVIDFSPYNLSAGSASANQKFGKVWLLPYNTSKNNTVSYPIAYTWYDELVISTKQIADPK